MKAKIKKIGEIDIKVLNNYPKRIYSVQGNGILKLYYKTDIEFFNKSVRRGERIKIWRIW